ncbi:MAG: DNA polymerase III subunit gamma/tau [Rikenellaceae bacterium]|nr:DNA polymerase III subunit gamma/tau [Rikenellaceae bacterium]
MEKFIVSARKYRPATFASVVGQNHITSTLKNAIERGQLAHAYLFCGPRGVGKTTCARIFAKAINCQHPVGAEACDKCDSCLLFNENRSLNIHELDAASNNSVEDIRQLIEQVRVLPQIGQYSVFIIDEVHMLSSAAFNAFLKTLEEPPKHAIFILATTEKHKIIPTILSRCQIYDFNRIRVEDAVGYLRYIAQSEGVEADDESLNLIAQKADGGMRDALSMFDKAVSFCGTKLEYHAVAATLNVLDYETYFRFTELLLRGDYVNALLEYDAVLSKGFSGQIFMSGLNQHFRDLLVAKGPAISLIEYTGSLLEKYRQQAAVCEPAFLFGAISLLTEADSKLRTSSSQRLLVELTLMKISTLGEKKNNELTAPIEAKYNLPDLNEPRQQVVVPTQPQVAATPQPVVEQEIKQPTVAPAPTPQPISEQVPTVEKIEPQKVEITPTPVVEVKPKSSVILGGSITSLLEKVSNESEVDGKSVKITIDPASEAKMSQVKERIVAQMCKERPRFVSAFEQIEFEGNVVKLAVPSEALRDELIEMRYEILTSIAAIAGVKGSLDMKIDVKEMDFKLKPIKLEDRVEHIRKVTPEFDYMQKAFDIDVE